MRVGSPPTGVGVGSGGGSARETMQTLPSAPTMGDGIGSGDGTASLEKRRYITPTKAKMTAPAMGMARMVS